MPTLNEVLSQADPSLVTAQQHLDWLDTTTEIPGDSTAYRWPGIGQKLLRNYVENPQGSSGCSPENWIKFNSLIGTLVGGAVLDNCLKSEGFDFSDSFNRQQIQAMEIVEPDWAVAVLDAMLAVGSPQTVAKWQQYGLDSQPMIGDIQSILLTRKVQQISADLQYGIQTGSLTTATEVKASADSLFDAAIVALGG